jgi:hypothetical protein
MCIILLRHLLIFKLILLLFFNTVFAQLNLRNDISGFLRVSSSNSVLQNLYDTLEVNSNIISYPIQFDFFSNSSRPYGWNNGSIIKSNGLQKRFSAGISFKSQLFDIVLKPEILYAHNSSYLYSTFFGSNVKGKFTRLFPGQSYIQFKKGNIGFKTSTQNIWWGPGQYNALMFSNNAPGFPHLSFHSNKPIKIKVGSFEWQLLAGQLKDDKVLPAESFGLKMGPISDRWRYLNAIILSWQPLWIPGLSLGFSRGIQFYGKGMDSFNLPFFEKYLPVITGFFKSKINTQIDAPGENDERDQQATFMLRYAMPKSNIEVYLEYGYADFKANLRDLAIDAQHGGAYILGLKKLLPVNKELYYTLNAEITHTSKTSHFITRNWTTWYTHGTFPQGFSHKNQILGAGSGLGNNMQTFHVERVSNASRLGVKIQKIQNNPSNVITNFNNIWLSSRRWTDFTLGPTFQFTHNRWSLKGEIQAVYAFNYAWLPENLFNMHFNSSLTYNW